MSVSRSFAWLDDSVEHSESDFARASALAKKWSSLQSQAEDRAFRRQADWEDDGCDLYVCEDCDACLAGDYLQCDQVKACNQRRAELEAERYLEIELLEDKLAAVGARIMRPYEHWNEDERYMEYMENRYDGY